ncbi:MAG: hypothetical protein D6814_11380, partial [Calditrichaeota bacterium]
AIEFARDKNALFVAAAGNESNDNDRNANYPSNYDIENVLAVAASDRNDRMASFSNFGRTTVDLAAPGVDVLSCQPRNRYQRLSGTSMATPHVSGAAALVMAQFPGLTYRQVMVRLMGSVDRKSAFTGKMVSNGRLNVAAALSTNPLVAFVTAMKNTADTTGPYKISAEAVDDGQVTQVQLSYSINGGAVQTLNMQPVGMDKYESSIPGQSLETSISYFVQATDNSGNVGKSQTFSFRVTNQPGGGGRCCGGSTFALSGSPYRPANLALAQASFLLLLGLAWMIGKKRK